MNEPKRIVDLTDNELDAVISINERKLVKLTVNSSERDFMPAPGETETMLLLDSLRRERNTR